MVCIYCGQPTKIINSRSQKRNIGTWRRHRCTQCGAVFTSLERVDYSTSLSFKDATSHIVPFSRDELFVSIYEACRHRPTARRDAAALADTVIAKLVKGAAERGLIARDDLLAVTAEALGAFDNAAAVHYAAYHRP